MPLHAGSVMSEFYYLDTFVLFLVLLLEHPTATIYTLMHHQAVLTKCGCSGPAVAEAIATAAAALRPQT